MYSESIVKDYVRPLCLLLFSRRQILNKPKSRVPYAKYPPYHLHDALLFIQLRMLHLCRYTLPILYMQRLHGVLFLRVGSLRGLLLIRGHS